MIQTELDCTRPEIMDDVQFWIKKWVFIEINWQITMNPSLSYQDCWNFKANWKTYLSETKKAQKEWDKEQLKKQKKIIN